MHRSPKDINFKIQISIKTVIRKINNVLVLEQYQTNGNKSVFNTPWNSKPSNKQEFTGITSISTSFCGYPTAYAHIFWRVRDEYMMWEVLKPFHIIHSCWVTKLIRAGQCTSTECIVLRHPSSCWCRDATLLSEETNLNFEIFHCSESIDLNVA